MDFITVEQAYQRLFAAVRPHGTVECVPLDTAAGRVAAEDVCARISQPPFDRSPLDGYALRAADFAAASREAPVTLPVSMKLYAGDAPQAPLTPGTAARIMTGAPVPAGADCVLRQEDTDSGEEAVTLYKSLRAGVNICLAGEDIRAGAAIVHTGEVLTSAHLGVLAGQGLGEVSVYKPVTVGVLATGSELLAAGAPWQPGRIYDGNGIQLAARLRQLGFAVKREACGDDPAEITATLRRMANACDAVVTTGGVSVGQKDYLPATAEALGANVLFHGLKCKPGSPMLAAMLGETPLLCLSGNPFAAAATLELLALPALFRLAGRSEKTALPRRAALTLDSDFEKASPNRRFLRAVAEGSTVHLPLGEHSSGSLSGMIGCNCLADIPAGSGALQKGEAVEVVYFEG